MNFCSDFVISKEMGWTELLDIPLVDGLYHPLSIDQQSVNALEPTVEAEIAICSTLDV